MHLTNFDVLKISCASILEYVKSTEYQSMKNQLKSADKIANIHQTKDVDPMNHLHYQFLGIIKVFPLVTLMKADHLNNWMMKNIFHLMVIIMKMMMIKRAL